jgi:hypothetical protein
MRKLTVTLIALFMSVTASAKVQHLHGRIYNGMPNLELAPFGQVVNLEGGEVFYVSSVISVTAPTEMDKSCEYEFTYIVDESKEYKAIKLVPMTIILECGKTFPKDK